MKKPCLLLFFTLLWLMPGNSLFGQCQMATAQTDLNINNVSARLLNGGDLWWDLNDGRYVVPKDDPMPKSSIFAGGLWMGGIDPGGNLKLAAQTYRQSGNDYWPGPLTNEGTIEPDTCIKWDRFFPASKADNDAHIQDFEDNGQIDGPVPYSVMAWPAVGNPEFLMTNGFNLPENTPLARFIDRNDNGIYEPMLGDYPDIPGDQAKFWIFNDAGNTHGQSGGEIIGMEVQVTAWADSSTLDYVNNTTFYEYKLIYKGLEPLDSFFFGLWVDPDLGCSDDDYIGCAPDKQLVYAYNADDFDEDCLGANGYQDIIPAVGVKILNTPLDDTGTPTGLSKFIYYNRGGTGSPGTEDPGSPIQFYRNLTGHWPDGTPLTFGGTGYNPGSTNFVDYAFPDPPSEPLPSWSMCSEDLAIGDRRMVISSGPFTVNPGDIKKISFAVVWTQDVVYPCPGLDNLFATADSVCNYYENAGPVATETIQSKPTPQITLTPNPANHFTVIKSTNQDQFFNRINIYQLDGRLVNSLRTGLSNEFVLETSDWNQGIYLVEVEFRKGLKEVKKLVIK